MNSFINDQLKRTSVRSYKDKPLEKIELNLLKKVINSVPTSINAQAFSAIFIQDKKILKTFSELNWGQSHLHECSVFILFILDSNRIKMSAEMHNDKNALDHIQSLEHYTVCVGDAYIAAQAASDAAISMGLGTCFIGGVRTYSEKICQLLNLPDYTMPIVGLTVGYPNQKNDIKPKINKVYDEKYSIEKVKEELDEYNLLMSEYYKERSEMINHSENDYSKNTMKTYSAFKQKGHYKTYEPTLRGKKWLKETK